LLKGLGEAFTNEAVNDMIKAADLDGDGNIQFDEFLKAVSK
jgi:Ca2+-binding EF-hand superfamily protein